MTISPEKLTLGQLISRHLKSGGKKQTDLARYLGVTQSAVSQMINGKTAPAMTQLEKICRFAGCDKITSYRLKSLLVKIKTGADNPRSIFNENLRKYRQRLELSVNELAELTKIDVEELVAMEELGNAMPTEKQLTLLAAALNVRKYVLCPPEFVKVSDGYGAKENFSEHYSVAENAAISQYNKENFLLPVIKLSDITAYDPAIEPLRNFAANYARRQIVTDFKPRDGYFVMEISENTFAPFLPLNSLLIVAGGEFSHPGNLVIAKIRKGGNITICRYNRNEDWLELNSPLFGENIYRWHYKKDRGFAEWIWPILEYRVKTCNLR